MPKPKTAAPIHPSAAIAAAYQKALQSEVIRPMAAELLRTVRAVWRDNPGIVGDARPDPKRLRVVMENWGRKWTARLETLAEKMARRFADASKNYTDRAMLKSFRDAGLTIQWRPTKRMLEGYAAVVYENVQLIRS